MTRHFRIKKIFNGTTEHFIVQQRYCFLLWLIPNRDFKSICNTATSWTESWGEHVKFSEFQKAVDAIQEVRGVLQKKAASYKRVIYTTAITV